MAGFEECMSSDCVLPSLFPPGTFSANFSKVIWVSLSSRASLGKKAQPESAAQHKKHFSQQLWWGATPKAWAGIDKSYITVSSAKVTFLCLQAPPERSGACSAGLAVGRGWGRAQGEQDTSAAVSTPSPCEICSKGSLNNQMSFCCYQPVTFPSWWYPALLSRVTSPQSFL